MVKLRPTWKSVFSLTFESVILLTFKLVIFPTVKFLFYIVCAESRCWETLLILLSCWYRWIGWIAVPFMCLGRQWSVEALLSNSSEHGLARWTFGVIRTHQEIILIAIFRWRCMHCSTDSHTSVQIPCASSPRRQRVRQPLRKMNNVCHDCVCDAMAWVSIDVSNITSLMLISKKDILMMHHCEFSPVCVHNHQWCSNEVWQIDVLSVILLDSFQRPVWACDFRWSMSHA